MTMAMAFGLMGNQAAKASEATKNLNDTAKQQASASPRHYAYSSPIFIPSKSMKVKNIRMRKRNAA